MELFESITSDKKLKLHPIDDNTILLSTGKKTEISILGICYLKVIRGFFDIVGFRINAEHSAVKVYSSKENSLKITCVGELTDKSESIDENYLKKQNLSTNLVNLILNNFSKHERLLMLSITSDSTHFIKYLDYYAEFPLFLNKALDRPSITHTVPDSCKHNEFSESTEWTNVISSLKCTSKILLAGGKGVGKSTLLRYLVNKSLNIHSKVLVLDFDPGQAEFTIMGCLSAVVVDQPLLGANFTHLLVPVKSFYLGSISVIEKLDTYVDIVNKIVDYCERDKDFRQIPWFINTMGFTADEGVQLIQNIISRILPTDVIQINSKKKKDNFPISLTPENVLYNKRTKKSSSNYRLHRISSTAERSIAQSDPATWGMNSMKKRSIVILSYFFPILKNGSINILECVPYRVNIKHLRIIITSGGVDMRLKNSQKLCSINGNMIALCCAKNEEDIMEFKGFGIVRGIDAVKEDIFVITPLNEAELNTVNIIHLHSQIQSPDIFKKQLPFISGTAPYVTSLIPSHLNQQIRKTSSRFKPYSLDKGQT